MPLWVLWWNALQMLRPAFSRLQTFLWFATTVAGFTVRTEHLGITSIVRALKLIGCYGSLIKHMHSSAVRLNDLNALWTRIVLKLFPSPIRVNGRRVFVGDGIKAPRPKGASRGQPTRVRDARQKDHRPPSAQVQSATSKRTPKPSLRPRPTDARTTPAARNHFASLDMLDDVPKLADCVRRIFAVATVCAVP
jgi:hypothetical protein